MYAAMMDRRTIRRPRPQGPWKRRGRQLILGATVLAALGLGFAQVAHGSPAAAYETVRVDPGDSLWSIASRRYPHSDVREKVGEIEQANHLATPMLRTGQVLKVPTV